VLPGFLVGILTLQLSAGLDASVTAIAAGVTVFFGAGALLAGYGGRLAERAGALRSMRLATLVVGVCLLSIAAFVGSLPPFLALLFVAGAANAVNQPAINLFMAEQVPIEHQGLAFGIKQSAIPGAILVSGLALPLIALPLGWRPTFALFGAAALLVALLTGRGQHRLAPSISRRARGRPTKALVLVAIGASLASAGPSALSAYLVVSAVDAGIGEGTAGLLAALGSLTSLAVRVGLGHRADLRGDYGLGWVIALLALGSIGFLLISTEVVLPFVAGAVIAYALGWGWPGLFNLAVVHSHRESPGWATGISQSGIYVGAAGGPAAYGLLSDSIGYGPAWAVTACALLLASGTFWLASRSLPAGSEPSTAEV
jgi:MFS family permease